MIARLVLIAGLALAALASTPCAASDPSAPAVASSSATALWRLPATASALRFAGEAGSRTWPFYVPARMAPGLKTFQLGYQGSIAVMPEASWISLTVNGQTVGRVPIAAPSGVKITSFDIPPGLVQPGWNEIGFDLSQRHRVDCSAAATYELWTQIDPTRTGFAAAAPELLSLADLPAIATDAQGTVHLHLAMSKDPSPIELARAVQAAERVALRAHLSHPVVDTVRAAAGLTLAVGTASNLSALLGTPVSAGEALHLGKTPDGGALLTVSGQTDEEVMRAVDSIDVSSGEPTGSSKGLAALSRSNGVRMEPGSSLTLAELGFGSRTFSGRLFREAFDIRLPPDAYPADYGEARLTLDGGYASGLAQGARLLVRVNGILDGNLEFDRPGGTVLEGQVVHIPLDAFRPGRNRIEIEAQVPARTDDACDTLSFIDAKERFLLLGTSRLSMPPLARVAQFPSLSSAMAGNLRVTPVEAPRLFLPRMSDGAVSALGTLLVNTSLNAGVPGDAVIASGMPRPGTAPAIVVGSASTLSTSLLQSAGLDAESIAAAWRPNLSPSPSGSGVGRPGRSLSDVARLDAWGENVESDDGWFGGAGAVLTSLTSRLTQSLRGAGVLSYAEHPLVVDGDTSFVFAQGMVEDTPVTLVTARDDTALATGTAALTEPHRLGGLHGRAASIEDGSSGTNTLPARDVTLFRTRPFSLTNDRLVAAGWVSKHAAWYLGTAFLAIILLGIATWASLRFGRSRSPA